MIPDKKKSGLSIMLAVGKKKDEPSYESDEAAPGGNDESEMMGESEPMGEPTEEAAESCLMIPKGFKVPSGSRDGEPFTTTVRGKIVDGKLMVEALGDVPMHSEQGETMEEEMSESPEEQAMEPEEESPMYQQEAKMMKKKRDDEMAARKVFQPGR